MLNTYLCREKSTKNKNLEKAFQCPHSYSNFIDRLSKQHSVIYIIYTKPFVKYNLTIIYSFDIEMFQSYLN